MVRENRRNPVKNLPRPSFVHHEIHMEGPRRELGTPVVGGKRLTACTTRPPYILICILICAGYVMKPFHRRFVDAKIYDRHCK